MELWPSGRHARRPRDVDRPPQEVLPCLLLLGRPAAGKSELVQFLKGLSLDERLERYHLGALKVLYDFPILWEKFLEDDIWEEVGKGRLLSARAQGNYYVTDDRVWSFLIEKLNRQIDSEPFLPGRTLIVEFSRGGEGAYRAALARLSRRALRKGAILYLKVSFQESWRRNQARYDRARKGGILTHSVPWEEMERTYRTDDWEELTGSPAGYLEVGGARVPYVTVENEPEPTSERDFSSRFRPAFDKLFRLWKRR